MCICRVFAPMVSEIILKFCVTGHMTHCKWQYMNRVSSQVGPVPIGQSLSKVKPLSHFSATSKHLAH